MSKAKDKFLFIANEPALDLLNTTPVTAAGPVDLLETFADLTHWLSLAGLMDESDARTLHRRWDGTKDADAAVIQVRKLREALREIVAARLDRGNPPPPAIDLLNGALSAASTTTQLRWNEKTGTFSRDLDRSTEGTPAHAITLVAEAAAALLVERDPSMVRRCESPSCVLHFLDTSKNHRRRWCSMEICGNRMKAAAHYRRQKKDAAAVKT